MPIEVFDHYTIRAADFEKTKAFYTDIMGMKAEIMTGLGFPIALMYLGDKALVHILGTGPELTEFLGRDGSAFTEGVARGTGNMEHVAFNATDVKGFSKKLRDAGIEFVERPLQDHAVFQILVDDPDGVEIEINFPLSEATL